MAVSLRLGPGPARLEVPVGTSLLAAVARARLPLGQSCRGQGVCNSCRVRVDAGEQLLSAPTELERRWRLPSPWRLACQTRVIAPAAGDEDATVALAAPAWGPHPGA